MKKSIIFFILIISTQLFSFDVINYNLIKKLNTSLTTSSITAISKNDASLGNEIITTQQDKDFSGANNWSGTNWSISGETFSHSAGANDAVLAGYSAVANEVYQITLTIVTGTAGTLTINYGGTASSAIGKKTGTLTAYTVVIIATNNSGLIISPNSTWVGSIDDISIKKLTISSPVMSLKNASTITSIEVRAVNSTSFGFGSDSLRNNTTGINNTFVGNQAGKSNVSSSNNTAIGYMALKEHTASSIGGNTAMGSYALKELTSGNSNTALGYSALSNSTTGYDNTAIGYQALLNLNSGYYNTTIGKNSGKTNTTGSSNTYIGEEAGYTNSTGSSNVCIGFGAGKYNVGSQKLYIDSFDRTNTAGDETGAIITGTMSSVATAQALTLNALTTVSNTLKISKTGDNSNLLELNSERPWIFKQKNSGSSASLLLESQNDAKSFQVGVTGSTNYQLDVLVGTGGYVKTRGVTSILDTTLSTSTTNGALVVSGGIGCGDGINATGDIETATLGKGFILKSPDGTRYRINVANGGALSASAVP